MKSKLTILTLVSTAFLFAFSCISQVKSNDGENNSIQESSKGDNLLTHRQLQMLSGITTIVLADYDDNQRPKKNRELTQTEIKSLIEGLANATKDTSLQIDNSSPYSHKLELKGAKDYFLTLLVYEDSKQLKVGDIQQGVVITGVNLGFLNSLKKIVERE